MKLREEDKEWLRGEIASQIRDHLYPNGWKKITYWLREWGLIGSWVGAFFALVAIAVTLGVVAFKRVGSDAAFQAHMEDFQNTTDSRLSKIEAALISQQGSNPPAKALKDISEASPKTFAEAIPSLKRVTDLPMTKVPVGFGTLQAVRQKLLVAPETTADYWPAVLQFIRFASRASASGVPAPGGPVSFHLTDVSGLGPFSHQVIELDGGVANIVFENCRIIFTDTLVRMQNVLFVNRVFELPVSDAPSPYIRNAARQILASNLTNVSIRSH